jgi:DNA primase
MTVQEILQRLNVDFTETSSGELILFCPRAQQGVHKNKRKLYLNPEKGVFICWQCDGKEDSYKGSAKRLLVDLGADLKWLKKGAIKNVDVDEIQKLISDLWAPESNAKEAVDEIVLPKEYSTSWNRSTFGKLALGYLRGRGLSQKKIDFYELGYCGTGYFKGYVIIPFYENNRLVYFQARRFFPYLSKPKYLNPQNATVGKADFIYGLQDANPSSPVIITEGVFDAMAVGKNGLSILGKKISDRQLSMLMDLKPDEVIVLLDRDAMEEANALARRLSFDLENVKLARLRKAKDPGSARRVELAKILIGAKPWNPLLGFRENFRISAAKS